MFTAGNITMPHLQVMTIYNDHQQFTAFPQTLLTGFMGCLCQCGQQKSSKQRGTRDG